MSGSNIQVDRVDRMAHKNYAPKTFADRGLYVSFTTPSLAGARVRLDQGGRYEFVVPNMFGGKGFYVMPWAGITECLTVTLYDRVLYEEMIKQNVTDPVGMRRVRLKVGATGLAGPRFQQMAKKKLSCEIKHKTLTHFLLLIHILKMAGFPTVEFTAGAINSDEGRRRMKYIIGKIATAFSLSYEEFYDRLEVLSDIISPIGLAQAPEPGLLRALVMGLISFQDYLQAWAEEMPSELGELADFEAAIAKQTKDLAEAAVAKVDASVTALPVLLKQWEKQSKSVADAINRIAWLLDGWDTPVHLCDEAAHAPPDLKKSVIVDSFSLLPVLPKEATGGITFDKLMAMDSIQRRWVRANEDWRSGGIDYDMVKKMEVMRATAP